MSERLHPDQRPEPRQYFKYLPEALLTIAMLGGWALITSALVIAFSKQWIWLLSTGVLLLAASGFEFIAVLVRKGLYVLSRGNTQTPQ